ncbi:MAG: adenine phosphoribosyltransferase [Spartobacteria bacterium]|nr:adenine phosphoribosyltransferase [Spartobacteria bacterium]
MSIEQIKAAIRDVPDFPQEGIIFKDITPVLGDAGLFKKTVDIFLDRYKGRSIDKIAAIDARGFIFGAALAYAMGVGVAPVRKKGKLPYTAIEESYALEYGTAILTMHVDAVAKGEKVLLIDDLLATGGTAAASASLIEQLGGEIVEIAFLVELPFLHGRDKLEGYDIFVPIAY